MYLVDTHVVFKRVRRDPALFLSSKVKDKVCNKGGEMAPGCNPLCATRVEVESSPEITDSGGGTCDGPARLQLWDLLLRISNSTANFYSINAKEAILGRATIRANRLCRCFTSSWEHKITCEPQALTGSAYYAATTLTKWHTDANECCTWRSYTRRLPCDLNLPWIQAAGTDKLLVFSEWSIGVKYGADQWVVTHPIIQSQQTLNHHAANL